jgi:cyclic pyranopterin phosphate synthase
MYDCFNRRIHYLRLSVTDRCNLACSYCRLAVPAGLPADGDLLSFDEMTDLVRVAAKLGFDKLRLTGGEPLLREGIVDLVGRLSRIPGLDDLAMTTNGLLLAGYAEALRAAGLQRLNISLDTLDPERFRRIAGGDGLDRVLAGIRAAGAAGFRQVKLNCVIDASPDEPDACAVTAFGRQQGMDVQLIRRMDLAAGRFWPVLGGKGGRCDQCNRLRVSCNGRVYPCLFNDLSYSIRELGAEAALCQAIGAKPRAGTRSSHTFSAIGG